MRLEESVQQEFLRFHIFLFPQGNVKTVSGAGEERAWPVFSEQPSGCFDGPDRKDAFRENSKEIVSVHLIPPPGSRAIAFVPLDGPFMCYGC